MGVSSKNEQIKLRPRITVIGVGGAGNNAVNNMIRSNLEGVEYLVCNTDAQHLTQSLVDPDRRVHLGLEVTQGLGAGSRPEIGRAAAEESLEDVMRHIRGSNMIFITAGMGGGTGTGAAPVIAKAARESGILTVGVITKPFTFEGRHRMRAAENGIKEMSQHVDTLITIPNQNLFIIADESTRLTEAFKVADHVLFSGVRSITDLMIMEGLINLDFADIRSIMTQMGKAMMGTGEASGAGRANAAAEAAISNPLLGDVSIRGARSILINITGGLDITLCEVDEAATRIQDEIDPERLAEANIIFGSTFDEKMEGTIRVSVIATGIDSDEMKKQQPVNANVNVGATTEIHADHKNLSDDLVFEDDKSPPSINDDFIDPVAGMAEARVSEGDNQESQNVASEAVDLLTPIHTFRSNNNVDSPDFNRPSSQDSKKGFFSRFIDTIAGRNLDDEPQANLTPGKQKTGIKRIRPTSIDDETDMQDVPAYLRRKSK